MTTAELDGAWVDGAPCPDCDEMGPHQLTPAALDQDGTATATCECGTNWTVIL